MGLLIKRILYIIFVSLILSACEKEDGLVGDNLATKDEFRDYVYALYKQWYFWAGDITEIDYEAEGDYELLFENLRNKRIDKWSFVSEEKSYMELLNTQTYYGLGARFTYDINNRLRVAYVYKDSPLGQLDVTRGWEVLSIDKQPVTISSRFKKKIEDIGTGRHEIVFVDTEKNRVTIQVSASTVHIENILKYKVLKMGGKSIGYLALGAFNKTDKVELERIFTYFANNKVKYLVLDLRYNSGGDISIVDQVAAHVLGPQHRGKLLYVKKHNEFQGDVDQQIIIPDLAGTIDANDVVVITGSATGSASELLINSLKPHVPLKIVGQQTAGKPFGMYVWNYNKKMIGLVAFRLHNSKGESDYMSGFSPDAYVFDDMDHELGSPSEACLHEALYYFDSNKVRFQRKRPLPTTDRFLYSGLVGKQGGY